jgi:hypothetical protein
MPRAWAASLPRELEQLALVLRTHTGVRAARSADRLWLRGEEAPGSLETALRRIAGLERFELAGERELVPAGRRVPTRRLPELDWRPLAELAPLELPPGALPGQLERRARLRLVRAAEEREAGGLLLALEPWTRWCLTAPAVRLERLEFACSGERVFVRGRPLPPLAGAAFVVAANAAWPAGWRLEPGLGPAALARLLALEQGDLALFDADGSWEHLPAQAFVRATRSAARATSEKAHG